MIDSDETIAKKPEIIRTVQIVARSLRYAYATNSIIVTQKAHPSADKWRPIFFNNRTIGMKNDLF